MNEPTDPQAVAALITGTQASRLNARGLAAAKRVSAEPKKMCLNCGAAPAVGGDQWWARWCAQCLHGWIPEHHLPKKGDKPRLVAVPDLPSPADVCANCGQGQPLRSDAARSENPRWCGSCNFERTDRRRRRRREPDP